MITRLDKLPYAIDPLDSLVWNPSIGWGIKGVEVTQAVQYYDSAAHLTGGPPA